jgi:small ligand-binding sensory domain FIST
VRSVAALSEHPLATHAFGECAGRLLELGGGAAPDLVVIWCTPPHAGALEDVVHATHRLLAPRVLVGSTTEGLLCGGRQVGVAPALSMLAVFGLGVVEPVRWHRDGAGVHHGLAGADGTAFVLADPFDLDVASVLDRLAHDAPDLQVVGGTVSGARHRGGNHLWLDRAEHRDGAVGVRFGPAEAVRAVLSQGTRGVGAPMTVTEADGRSLVGLAGAPAVEVLRRVVSELEPDDQLLAAQSLEVGLVDRPHGVEPTPEQLRVVPVRGVDPARGALVLDGEAEVGATARFHLRDPRGADEDLREVLSDAESCTGALVCASTSLDAAALVSPDHRATLLAELLPDAAIAGMSSVDELGPVAGVMARRHGTTSLLLFG